MTSTSDKHKTRLALDKMKGFELLPYSELRFQEPKSPLRDRSVPKELSKPPKRKRTSSPERKELNGNAAPLKLHLPKAVAAGPRAREYVGTRDESPWNRFRKAYELKFEVFTTVAMRKASPCEVVMVKEFQTPEGIEKLRMLQQIRHENFIAFLEPFQQQESSYAILEHVFISLSHRSPPPLPILPSFSSPPYSDRCVGAVTSRS
jgi:hypothetical protein